MRLLVCCTILLCCGQTAFTQTLQPIDSVYVNQLLAFSNKAQRFTKQVWPGMSMGPACIFRQNGPAFLINHPRPPANATYLGDSIYMFKQADLALAGTAQTDINGYLTAHHHYDQSFFISDNQFYAELFHELHHVYQRNHIKTIQFDNPAILLTYPEDHRNDALKQYENECLLAMVQEPAEQFIPNLNRFFSCRMARRNIIGEKYLNYEKSVESAEGPATYCEYQYMQAFGLSLAEKQYTDKRFFYSLIEPSYGREGLRNKHLLSGMLQCLLLSRTVKNWQSAYYQSGLSLNDYFFTKFIPKQIPLPDLSTYQAKATYFTALVKEKHTQHLAAFHQQGGVKVTLLFKRSPDFRGFDPMHAESINDSLTLHSTLFKVGRNKDYLTVVDQPVLSLTKGQIWFVKQVTFFAPASAVSFSDNTFSCQTKQITVNWQYLKHEKTKDGYLLMLE